MKKKTERFYFNSDVEKEVTRYTDYITPLHIKSLRYRYRRENEGLAALIATIIFLNTKKRKIML